MEAEILALAREKSEMRRRMELETREATRQFNETNEAYLTEYKLNMALRQQCDRLGVGIFGGHLPNLSTNRQMEGHAAEEQRAGPSAEMDRA
ncbi:hypothetical protein GCK32_006101 [Trichostrongylus colubriformis]|uniref:Uncharacterized protein n=1 Tax=Trichostrongylus colubriformis TaxID=6319 RepID=A0AAN8IHF0_TRICO